MNNFVVVRTLVNSERCMGDELEKMITFCIDSIESIKRYEDRLWYWQHQVSVVPITTAVQNVRFVVVSTLWVEIKEQTI